jgi:hypothetical protein
MEGEVGSPSIAQCNEERTLSGDMTFQWWDQKQFKATQR